MKWSLRHLHNGGNFQKKKEEKNRKKVRKPDFQVIQCSSRVGGGEVRFSGVYEFWETSK